MPHWWSFLAAGFSFGIGCSILLHDVMFKNVSKHSLVLDAIVFGAGFVNLYIGFFW